MKKTFLIISIFLMAAYLVYYFESAVYYYNHPGSGVEGYYDHLSESFKFLATATMELILITGFAFFLITGLFWVNDISKKWKFAGLMNITFALLFGLNAL